MDFTNQSYFLFSEEDHFFANIILDSTKASIQFKLAPTYTIYLAVRFSLSNGYRPDLSAPEKAMKITSLVIKIANLTHQAIHVRSLSSSYCILHGFTFTLCWTPMIG